MVAFGQSLGAAKAIQQQKREQNPVQVVGLLDEIKPLIKRSLSSVGLLDEALDVLDFFNPQPSFNLKDLTETERAAALVGKEKGIDSSFIINNIIKPMAFHESGGTYNPNMIQEGTEKNRNLGRGLLQFERERFKTAVQRARNYLERKNLPQPEWLKNINRDKDIATSLTGDQQMALGVYDLREHPDADMSKVFSGKQSILDFWLENWWQGNKKDREDRIRVFNANHERYKRSLENGQ